MHCPNYTMIGVCGDQRIQYCGDTYGKYTKHRITHYRAAALDGKRVTFALNHYHNVDRNGMVRQYTLRDLKYDLNQGCIKIV